MGPTEEDLIAGSDYSDETWGNGSGGSVGVRSTRTPRHLISRYISRNGQNYLSSNGSAGFI